MFMLRKTITILVSCLILLGACASRPYRPGDAGQVQFSQANPDSYHSAFNAISVPAAQPARKPPESGSGAGTESGNPAASANGPDQFPEGVNPLTGLVVTHPENLTLPPAFVSVTNFPTTARPQAGLSFSPFVFEMYIGEGMTRFLAMFYGDLPDEAAVAKANGGSSGVVVDYSVGPIRSGRLPYESIRKQYGGFLVMASAWSGVASQLSDYNNIFGSDSGDVNSAMIQVTDLQKIAEKSQDRLKNKASLSGLRFDPLAPSGGQAGNMLWIPYNFLNQVIWRYDPASGAYNRYQDDADGVTFLKATDRLTQKGLAFENVVVMYVNHRARAETLIDLDLSYQNPTRAVIFRNGQMYDVFWTTKNAEFEKQTGQLRPIRFVDAQGNPFPLNPGKTWVEIVPAYTPVYETVDSTAYLDLVKKETPGSGNWAFQFYAPKITGK
jgi:hypothetical protein